MICTVVGGTKKERATVEEALCFAKEYWLPRHRKLWVDVEIKRNLDVDADVLDGDDDREFVIRLKRGLDYEDLVTAIFHEMVHVKQWAKGEMQELVRQSKTRFNGTLFGETEYWDRPWEIEAHGREKGLFVRWAETTGKCNEAWTQENLY